MTEVVGAPLAHDGAAGGQPAEGANAAAESVSPGAMLERGRAERGLSVADVAQRLKYGARQIEALERDDYAHLPGTTFVRGMIRGYARLLQIDPVAVLAEFDRRHIPIQVSVDFRTASIPFPVGSKRSTRVYGILSGIIVVAVVVVVVEWQFGGIGWLPSTDPVPVRNEAALEHARAVATADRQSEAIAADSARPTSVPLSVTPVPAEPGAVAPAPRPAAAAAVLPEARTPDQQVAGAVGRPVAVPGAPSPTGGKSKSTAGVSPASVSGEPSGGGAKFRSIAFHFDRDSWVEIRQGNGKILMSQLNRGGTDQVIEGTPPFDVIIGNAPSVRVTYNNAPVDLRPYFKVDVARLTLD